MSRVQEKQAERRREILGSVIELLKKRTFEEVGVNDICAAAGISVGSFYHYFGQKSDLLVGLMGLIDEYMERNVFPYLGGGSAYDDLLLLTRGFAGYVESGGIEISKLISRSCPTDYGLDNKKRPLYTTLAGIIQRGADAGEFITSLPAEKIADLVLMAISGVAVDWSRRDGGYSIEARMEEFTALFLPALLINKQ